MHLVDDHGRAMDAEYHVEADGGHFALIMESRSGMPGTRAPTTAAAAGASHRSQYPQTSPDPSPIVRGLALVVAAFAYFPRPTQTT